jgi:hypothetical protein
MVFDANSRVEHAPFEEERRLWASLLGEPDPAVA